MTHIAVIYHTVEGQTEKIAERIAATARGAGAEVDLFPVASAPGALDPYSAVVVGGSVHAGHHHKDLLAYATRHAEALRSRPSAFFSVGLMVTQEDEAWQHSVHGFVDTFIEESGWHPDLVAIFGGALAYTRYGFIKRQAMRVLARKMHAPTDTSHDYEYTDWEAVDVFARDVVEHAKHVR